MNLTPIFIDAVDLPDAWFQLIHAILDQGREFKIDQGSFAGQTRLEFDYATIQIREPYLRDLAGWPLIPIMPESSTIPPPTTIDYLADYARYILTADKEPTEQYTYGQRLFSVGGRWPASSPLNQVAEVIRRYKEGGHRNNQMVLQIAAPFDLLLSDPPCLRHIDTRIQDGQLHFFIYFRSWDLWGGFPSNLAGLSMLQEYMAAEIGVEPGEFICSSKGLHLYDYAVPFAELRCLKSSRIEE